ncbi:hypothetical protein ES703_89779 [subsurface metagenome]
MDFLVYISTKKGTLESAPKITPLYLTKGLLAGGFIYFPSGPAGTLHFLARMGTHQIVPFNTGENYRLDDCVVPFHLAIDLGQPPFEIECITWNDSTQYAHALTVCFFLQPTGKYKRNLDKLKDIFKGTRGYSKP